MEQKNKSWKEVFKIHYRAFEDIRKVCPRLFPVIFLKEILELSEVRNTYTDEKVYQMTLECNNMVFRMAINEADLLGEPAVGRRFKGQVWLQGRVQF